MGDVVSPFDNILQLYTTAFDSHYRQVSEGCHRIYSYFYQVKGRY